MSATEDVILAELLCARLCHDLAGPIGAVTTGAELLSEENEDIGGEALALLETSAKTAGSRLRFLRQAFGLSSSPVGAASLREMAESYFGEPATGGVVLDWEDGSGAAFAPGEAKLVLNLLLLAQDCLPRGGTVIAYLRQNDGLFASISAEGRGAAAGASMAGMDARSVRSLNSREAQGYYTTRLAADSGLGLETLVETGRVRLKAR